MFSNEVVQAVTAHTLAEANGSNRVLQMVGMSFTVAIDDPEGGKIWRWQICRGSYRSA